MPEREYVLIEHFVTAQYIYVRAASKAEALAKVKDGATVFTEKGDIYPARPISVHDIRVSNLDMTCEVCGLDSMSSYLIGQRKKRGRCGKHTEPKDSDS